MGLFCISVFTVNLAAPPPTYEHHFYMFTVIPAIHNLPVNISAIIHASAARNIYLAEIIQRTGATSNFPDEITFPLSRFCLKEPTPFRREEFSFHFSLFRLRPRIQLLP